MVETAPFMIEYLCEPYVNYSAVKLIGTSFGLFSLILALGCFALGLFVCHQIHCNLEK